MRKYNAKLNNGKVNSSSLGIGSTNINRLRVIKDIKVDIPTNKSKISILFCFYLNILILLRLIIYYL